MRASLRLIAPVAVLAGGCAHPLAALTLKAELDAPGAQVTLAYASGDASDAKAVAEAVRAALPRLTKWGELKAPVTIYLARNHGDLETAVRRPGYDWLRAWARADDVVLQTPSSWPRPAPPQADLDQLLLHELTHCLTFQLAALKGDWTGREIPLWFREGLALYTAGQGGGFGSLEDLARFYQAHPGLDPIGDPEPIQNTQHGAVYGAAFHAFTFLVRRNGERVVPRLLHSMSVGRTFAQAFEDVLGFSEENFLTDFRHYVQWRGFKGRPGVHAASPVP